MPFTNDRRVGRSWAPTKWDSNLERRQDILCAIQIPFCQKHSSSCHVIPHKNLSSDATFVCMSLKSNEHPCMSRDSSSTHAVQGPLCAWQFKATQVAQLFSYCPKLLNRCSHAHTHTRSMKGSAHKCISWSKSHSETDSAQTCLMFPLEWARDAFRLLSYKVIRISYVHDSFAQWLCDSHQQLQTDTATTAWSNESRLQECNIAFALNYARTRFSGLFLWSFPRALRRSLRPPANYVVLIESLQFLAHLLAWLCARNGNGARQMDKFISTKPTKLEHTCWLLLSIAMIQVINESIRPFAHRIGFQYILIGNVCVCWSL